MLFEQILRDAELNHPSIKRHYLAFIFFTQKLRHYLLAHPLNLVTKSNSLKYLLSRLAMLGCITCWLLHLNEFAISVVAPKELHSQALLDLLA